MVNHDFCKECLDEKLNHIIKLAIQFTIFTLYRTVMDQRFHIVRGAKSNAWMKRICKRKQSNDEPADKCKDCMNDGVC